MISVEEALQRIGDAMPLLPAEIVPVSAAGGRVLAEALTARRTQPPVAVSAMDGWAVRAADVAQVPAALQQIGEAPAGGSFAGRVGPGQAVRIFTGGPLPAGADCIAIQENVTADGDHLVVRETVAAGRHIRVAGLDFRTGDALIQPGKRLGPADVALAAAMDYPWLAVRRRPRIAVLATGDELARPGEPAGPNQIVSSNGLALAALIGAEGGEVIDLGIARDNREDLLTLAAGARGADMLVTLGGASVGDHDLVQNVLREQGLVVDFWRIAMRPGKPLIFGASRGIPLLGLPGNPVSSLVCALVFLRPALRRMQGIKADTEQRSWARLGRALPANDQRQDYLRASLSWDAAGERVATPFKLQDSSMLSLLSSAGCLVIRPPQAAAAAIGDRVEILPL